MDINSEQQLLSKTEIESSAHQSVFCHMAYHMEYQIIPFMDSVHLELYFISSHLAFATFIMKTRLLKYGINIISKDLHKVMFIFHFLFADSLIFIIFTFFLCFVLGSFVLN